MTVLLKLMTIALIHIIASPWTVVPIDAGRILSVSTLGSKSHWSYMRGILRALTDHGHNVTSFNPVLDGDRENYTEIGMSDEIEVLLDIDTMRAVEEFGSIAGMMRTMHRMSRYNCRKIFENRIMKDILSPRSSEKFDVLITETFESECISTISTILGIPLIYVFAPPIMSTYTERHVFGHIPNPAIVPNLISSRSTPKTFSERFANSGLADVLQFIEESPRGVILFTLGSIATISTLPEHIQKIIKEVLAQVPQRVLIKYEDQMKDKPENVMTTKWIPQRDILLHPNVKLFISHGGISSTYEAVDAGVPVIGFPLFFDQSRNIETLVNVGMAISLDLMSLTKITFLNAIHDIINNTEYSKNAKLTSKLFKDRPMSPKESVIYWTEYVIRHKGAPHLQPQTYNLSWYQYYLLDVISVILLVIILGFYMLCKILDFIMILFLNNYRI